MRVSSWPFDAHANATHVHRAMVSHAPSRMMRLGLSEWRRGGNQRIVPDPLFTVVRTED